MGATKFTIFGPQIVDYYGQAAAVLLLVDVMNYIMKLNKIKECGAI